MKHTRYSAAMLVLFASTGAVASSLPQMDRTWYPNQLLWLAISFALLYAGVSLFIAPAIKSVLDTRDAAINDAIREAEIAKREAEVTRGGSESAHHEARVRASDVMAKTIAEISAEASEQIAKLGHDIARRADHAEVVLAEAIAKARAGIDQASEGVAQAMVEHLLSGAEPSASKSTPNLKLASSR